MEEFLQAVAEAINKKLIEYWEMQGHLMTDSKFVQELETVTGLDPLQIEGFSVGYAKYINRGVSAQNIPYSRGSGAGRSKYIQGLARYVEHRMGLQGKEALSVAFAIANKHKQDGMPTPGSTQYSQTGQRTGFLDNAFAELEREGAIEKLADYHIIKLIDTAITKAI